MVKQFSDSVCDRIIAAAAARFIVDGYEGTSMLAVAGDAKTSKRAIYDEFGSKERLFEKVMGYLCALGGNADTNIEPVSLKGQMTEIAHAVMTRFLLQETRGILIAAIGASAKFPEIPNMFWEAGPGQAVTGLTELFLDSPEVKLTEHRLARITAHRFLMSCVAPFTLSYLFDPNFRVTKAEIDAIIESVISITLNQIT